MQYFLAINEIAMNFFEVRLVADVYCLEATLLLADDEFAEVFDLLSFHTAHFKL
jgi:hypothetical protein